MSHSRVNCIRLLQGVSEKAAFGMQGKDGCAEWVIRMSRSAALQVGDGGLGAIAKLRNLHLRQAETYEVRND